MATIIITRGSEYLKGNPTLYLRANKMFSDMGFKDVQISSTLRENQYFKELTLFVYPSAMSRHRSTMNISDQTADKWRGMEGYNSDNYSVAIRTIRNYDTDKEKVVIDGEYIGDYYKNRNLIILFYPIHNVNLETKNAFFFYFLEEFGKEIERIKPEIVDISKMERELLIRNFLSEIKRNIVGFSERIADKERDLVSLRNQELSVMSEISQNKEGVESLNGVMKTMEKGIDKKIKEIKKLPFVKSVRLSSLGIRVDFKTINLKYEEKDLELGDCYCYLNPNKLEIKNKNYVVFNGTIYHSPHIKEDTICFGNGKSKAYELLAGLKLKELTYFLYLYLKTYNNSDAYLHIENWEKCKKHNGKYNDGDDEE